MAVAMREFISCTSLSSFEINSCAHYYITPFYTPRRGQGQELGLTLITILSFVCTIFTWDGFCTEKIGSNIVFCTL